jgi:hypothetical protein
MFMCFLIVACGESDSDDNSSTSTDISQGAERIIGSSGSQTNDGSSGDNDDNGGSSGDDDPDTPVDTTTDTDGDGLTDYLEASFGSDKNDTDTDDDGLDDLEEYNAGLDPNNPDTDGDSIGEAVDLTPGTYTLKAMVDYAGDDLDGCYKKSTFRGTLNQATGEIAADSGYNIYYSYTTLTGATGDSTLKMMIYSTSAGIWRLLATSKVEALQKHPNDFQDGDILDYDFSTYGYNATMSGTSTIEGAEVADGSAIEYVKKACFHIGDAADPAIKDYLQFVELGNAAVLSDQLIVNSSYHAFYAHDDGDYYLIAYNQIDSKWQLYALGALDPASILGGDLNPVVVEDIGTSSKTLNGALAPDTTFVQY